MKLKALKYFTSVKLGGEVRAGKEFETDDKKLIKDLVDAELVALVDKPQTQGQPVK